MFHLGLRGKGNGEHSRKIHCEWLCPGWKLTRAEKINRKLQTSRPWMHLARRSNTHVGEGREIFTAKRDVEADGAESAWGVYRNQSLSGFGLSLQANSRNSFGLDTCWECKDLRGISDRLRVGPAPCTLAAKVKGWVERESPPLGSAKGATGGSPIEMRTEVGCWNSRT